MQIESFAVTRQVLKSIFLFFISSLTSIEGKPLMGKNIFPGAVLAVICSSGSFWQLWFKAPRIHWHSSGSWHHEASLSSWTPPTTLFGAAALPKAWWSPAQAAPLAGKVEEEKHICVFSWTIQPCSLSLSQLLPVKRQWKIQQVLWVLPGTQIKGTERILELVCDPVL